MEALECTFRMMDAENTLLYASDYPHHHHDDSDALPDGLSAELIRKMTVDNPRATYPRLAVPAPV